MLGTAHPRSRGENGQPIVDLIITVGSSPLTRGKPLVASSAYCAPGLIPAHAGKTQRCGHLRRTTQAHPRSRGENGKASAVDLSAMGSSPLTRGKHAAMDANPIGLRLIPAHAGKTPSGGPGSLSTTAHPRSRGENRLFAFWGVGVVLAWGRGLPDD